MIVAIQIIEKFCARSCKWNDCFSCTFDSALVKSWWQGSPTFSAFSYYWVHFSFKMQLNERSCRYKWKMTITRMPKVVMMSAFHLVLVKSQSNNFKLWWSQLSPQIHTDYTTTTSNYDGPSCLLIPLLTISSDPPSRQEPKQMDVHRCPLFLTHQFSSSSILALTSRKMPKICTLLLYFIFCFLQLYSRSYPLTISTGYSFTFWLHTPP